MTCPHLEYREDGDGQSFDVARAFCGVTGSFVQPMRADVCNDRYDLHHAEHCEFYREHEAESHEAESNETESKENEVGEGGDA